jgi:transposase InsO family protein
VIKSFSKFVLDIIVLIKWDFKTCLIFWVQSILRQPLDFSTYTLCGIMSKNRSVENGLLFHTDRGVKFASKKFTNVVDSYKTIKKSMSRKGNCWDNAVAESFFKTLKTEQIYGNKLISKEQMERDIFVFIEIWHNRKRRHSASDYKTI